MKTICAGDSESPPLEESPASVTPHRSGFRTILMGLRLVTQSFSPYLLKQLHIKKLLKFAGITECG